MKYNISHVWVYTLKTKDNPKSEYVADWVVKITVEDIDAFKQSVKLGFGQNTMVCLEYQEEISPNEFSIRVHSEMKNKVKTNKTT